MIEQFEQAYDQHEKDISAFIWRKDKQDLINKNGIPLAIKDNISEKGTPLSCGSKMLEGYVAPYSATVVNRLNTNGYTIVGHTNMDEFAMGSSTENSAYYPTKNPLDLSRVPGGSSGGSVAAVAAGMVPVALGSETGGSVRQPAAFCGVVGLRPTYGRISRYGLVAFASSLDQISPCGQSVDDVERLFMAIEGQDAMDATTIISPDVPTKQVSDLVIGVPQEYFNTGLEACCGDEVMKVIESLKKQGATIKEVSMPLTDVAVETYYVICTAEASSNLARFDGLRYGFRAKDPQSMEDLFLRSRDAGFGMEVKRRILLGTYVLSSGYYDAYYNRARAVREQMKQNLKNIFSQVDILIGPTTPTAAFKFGAKKDPIEMYLSDIYTVMACLTGVPSISIPAMGSENLPVGIQLHAPWGGEKQLFSLSREIEKIVNYVPKYSFSTKDALGLK